MKTKFLLLYFLAATCSVAGQNVGIGTTTPLVKLHVSQGASGNTTPLGPFLVEGNSNTYINVLSPNASETGVLFGKTSDAVNGGIVYNNIGTLNGLQLRTNGNSTKMVVDQNGNVGIGTLNPNAPLGFPALLGKKITLYPGGTGDVGFAVQGNLLQIYSDNPGADIAFGYDVSGTMTERMRIKGNGNVGIGTNNPLTPLHVNGVSFFTPGGSNIQILDGNRIQGYINGGLNLTTFSDDPIKFTTFTSGGGSGGERMRISSNGNVGIGTATPAASLEVNGYTKLGSDAPSVKVKKLTGTTASTEGGYVDIYLGVDQSKILSISVLVLTTGVGYSQWYGPNTGGLGASFFYYNGSMWLTVVNHPGDSAGILSKPIKIFITYEE
ncbi:MAG: hypothetical protein IPP96_03480 [Chitinophagaceae bacterium]|nr:hypothetical protein [Chitinophagaceae bacterium]